MLYVSISDGIGTSLVLNKQTYKGNLGFAGDAGHMTFDINGEVCDCGNIGCWQHYASVTSLLNQSRNIIEVASKNSEPTMEQLLQLANDNNYEVTNLLEQIGRNIGLGISNIIHIQNPELIVIGGKMTAAKDWIKEPLLNTIKKRANIYYENDLRISFSHLGHDSIVLGATSMGISHLFKETRVTIS